MNVLSIIRSVFFLQLVRMQHGALSLLCRLCELTHIQFSKVRLSISSNRLIYQLYPKTFQQAAFSATWIAPLPDTCASNMIVSPYETEERNTLLRTPRNNLESPLSSSRPFLVALG